MKEDHLFCRSCGRKITTEVTGGQIAPSQPQPQPNEWLPILWLILIVIASFLFPWIGGVIVLVAAAIWVEHTSKKYGVEVGEGLWALILLFAIVGLPLYAYRLHQFREKQKSN